MDALKTPQINVQNDQAYNQCVKYKFKFVESKRYSNFITYLSSVLEMLT